MCELQGNFSAAATCCCFEHCLRKKGQFLKERQKPASLHFSFSQSFYSKAISNSTVADFHLWLYLPLDLALCVSIGAMNSWNNWQILQNVYVTDLLDVTVPWPRSDVLIVTVCLNYCYSRLLPEVSFNISIFTNWNIFLFKKVWFYTKIFYFKIGTHMGTVR